MAVNSGTIVNAPHGPGTRLAPAAIRPFMFAEDEIMESMSSVSMHKYVPTTNRPKGSTHRPLPHPAALRLFLVRHLRVRDHPIRQVPRRLRVMDELQRERAAPSRDAAQVGRVLRRLAQ